METDNIEFLDKDPEQIAQTLISARDVYYNSETPILSDIEFDMLEEKLRQLEPNHSYFSTVGIVSDARNKISHLIPMLSMGKAKIPSEVIKWMKKLALPENTPFIVQPKIDGISATCRYEKGELVCVATRGDGTVGQDITHIAPYVKDILPSISYTMDLTEVRGELYLPKNTLYNTEGRPLRNNCAGLINRKEAQSDLKYLRFVAYQIAGNVPVERESQKIKLLEKEGFNTVVFQIIKIAEELEAGYLAYINQLRDEWLYETDGLIIAVNETALHQEIDSRWVVDHHHHYNLALKPPPAGKETKLKGIEWQVSRQGNLVPVANFEPIELVGAIIERATLHNFRFADKLSLAIGDRLIIERANDVIPYVRANLSLDDRKRNLSDKNKEIFSLIPKECPECHSSVELVGVHLRCSNTQCPERRIQTILYWVKRSGIENIAGAILKTLYNKGIVTSIADLYGLTPEKLEGLEGFAEKRISDMIKQIAGSKRMDAVEFIGKLGIPLVQKKALRKLGILSVKDFFDFSDITYVIGQNIIDWRDTPANKELLNELISVLDIVDIDSGLESDKPEVCMTGKGPLSRNELIAKIEAMGYSFSSSLTKETAILLCENPEASSSKLVKARKYGAEILRYEHFFKN